MKNLQKNLLITLAICLCGLCAWQWYYQTVQRQWLQDRNQTIYKRDTDIQGYTNSLDKMNQQINRMEQDITGLNDNLKETVRTNSEVVIGLRRETARLRADNDTLTNDIFQYTNAISALQINLQTAYDGIKTQNTNLELLASDRDKWVGKYTNVVNQYNELVGKYTNLNNQYSDLVGKYNRLVTNTPAK